MDGLFLHRDELVDLWDVSLWVDGADRVVAARVRRAIADAPSDGALLTVHLLSGSSRIVRYVDGMNQYINSCSPQHRASIIIDNNDLAHPVRLTASIADNDAG